MQKAAIVVLILVFFSLFCCNTKVIGQDSANSLVSVSSTEVTFYGKEGVIPETRDLIVIGLEDGVKVELIPLDLYLNDTGKRINLNLNRTTFPINKSNIEVVNIELGSPDKAGTYDGKLIVMANNTDGNFTTSNISIIAVIEAASILSNELVKYGIVIAIGVLVLCGLLFPEDWTYTIYLSNWIRRLSKTKVILSKKVFVVIFGVIVAFLWFLSLLYYPFGDPASVLQTILIAPFLTYAVGIVKDKRTERLEKEKVSRGIRDDGIKKDIDLIRNLIGELATHCSSFMPNYYEEKMEKPPDKTPLLLYPKTGIVAKKVWEESCKQGFVADIHTLHLEKYYDQIPFYNQCYSHAMTLVRDNKSIDVTTDDFLRLFEEFRKTYGRLQKVLFVYLTYILEFFSKTTLSPMKLEYPRITRTLLYKLIDYEILKPFRLIDKLSEFNKIKLAEALALERECDGLENATEKASSERMADEVEEFGDILEKFKKYYLMKIPWKAEFKKTRPSLIGNKEEFNKEFKRYILEKLMNRDFEESLDLKEEFLYDYPDLKEDIEQFHREFKGFVIRRLEYLEAVEEWLTMKFMEKIEWWELTADDLETIVEEIYAADEIPHFFRHMQDDFQKTYLELKECVRKLLDKKIPDAPKDSEVKEYKISLGNIYKKVEEDEKDKKEDKLEPDTLKVDLNAEAKLNIKEKTDNNN